MFLHLSQLLSQFPLPLQEPYLNADRKPEKVERNDSRHIVMLPWPYQLKAAVN